MSIQRLPLFIKNAAQAAKNDNNGSADFLGPLFRVLDMLTFDLITVDGEDFSHIIPNSVKQIDGVIGSMQALLTDQVGTPASKQMLIHNVFSASKRDPLSNALLSELDSLGYPKGKGLTTTNIAVTKGSITGNNLAPESPYYFNFRSNHAGSGSGVRTINVTADVMGAAPYPIYVTEPGCYSASCVDFSKTTYGTYVFSASMRYKDISSFGSDTYSERFTMQASKDPAYFAWDIMPCSTIDIPAAVAAEANPQLSELNLTNNGDFAALQKDSCFIPTYSALGQKSAVESIPFDTYYGQSGNLSHLEFKSLELREKGSGNYFEDDFKHKYLNDTYVKNSGWSGWVYNKPKSSTSSVSYKIYSSPSEYACYMSWGYTGRVIKWVSPNKCYVRNP